MRCWHKNCIHSCHERITFCMTIKKGWQESCHPYHFLPPGKHQGVLKKREGVWGKTSRRLGENTKAFWKVCIRPHIPILPLKDTISYRVHITNLTAIRLVIFRRKLVGDRSDRKWKDSCHPLSSITQEVKCWWQEWKEILRKVGK